jgi:hypothetical protein
MSCDVCADGYISPDGEICLACPAGREDIGEVCVKCANGRIAALGGQRCQKCAAGRESDDDNVNCRKCGRKKFSTEGGMCQACGLLESSEEGASECYPVFRVVVKDEDGLNSTTGRIKKAPPRGANFLSFDTGEVAIAIPGLSKADTDFSLAVWILLSSEVNQSAPVLRLGEYKVRVEGVSGLRLIGFGDVIEIETVPDTWTHLAVTYNPTSNSGAYYVNGTKSSIGAGVTGRRLLQAPATTEDFSCDATLLMRYAFDDPANPGIDSVSGISGGITGDVTATDGYAIFNGGAVRLQPLTVLEGDDITFTWWMKPLSNLQSRHIFRMGENADLGRIQWYRAGETHATASPGAWMPLMQTPPSGWVSEILDPNITPFDSTWSFMVWKIRASDGLWSITVNEDEVFRGVKIAVHPQTYDDPWHHIASTGTFPYLGALDDFRIYRSFLSDEQVAAVRAGGPASTCAAPVESASTTQPILWYKMDDPAAVGHESISGADATVSNVAIDSTSALPAVAEGCEAAARFSTADQQFDPLPFTITNSEMTLSLWVRPALTQEDYASILDLRNHLSAGFVAIRIYKEAASDQSDTTKTWVFWVKAGETLDCVPGSCAKIPIVLDVDPPQWVHIAFRIQSTGEWTITVNGVEVYKQPTVPMASVTYAVNHIGNHPNSLRRLDAHMRDFRLYDQALSDAELGALYTSSLDFCSVPQPEPVTTTPAPEVDDFSCDAGLVMRYAFDDPANPGLDSISGLNFGRGGMESVDGVGVFDGVDDGIGFPTFTIHEGDDVTISFWLKPTPRTSSVNLFRIGGADSSNGRIQLNWPSNGQWKAQMRDPITGNWPFVELTDAAGATLIPSSEWTFMAWSLRASDGLSKITINGVEVHQGLLLPFHPRLYDEINQAHHSIGGDGQYLGSVEDFRIYRSFLSDEQVAAVRAGGPATACAAPVDFSCDAGLVMRYPLNNQEMLGKDRVSGNTAGVSASVTVHDSSYATFNNGGVRLEPFTVLPEDSIAFSFWINPDSSTRTSAIQDVIRLRKAEQSSEGVIQIRWSTTDVSRWTFVMKREDDSQWNSVEVTILPDTWSFVLWQIHTDGEWSIHVNDMKVFEGTKQALFPALYNGRWHDLAFNAINPNGWTLTTFYGSLRDFRIYRSFLSDEQVAAVRAGGPASTCATSDSGNVDEGSLLVGGDPESNEYFSGAVDDVRLYEVQLSDGDVAVISLTAESETAVLNPVNFSTECVNETNIVFQTPFDNIDFMASMGSYGLEYFGNFDGVYYLDHESDPPRHQCAVLKNGSLGCWGDNSWGQSGGVFEVGGGLQEVCVGAHHSCYLQNYSVTCFGSDIFNQTQVPPDLGGVRSIACGSRFTCALLLSNDEVRCWGDTDNKTVAVSVIPNASACGQARRVYGEVRIRILSSSAPAITSTSMPETLVPLLSDFFLQVAGIGDGYLEVVPWFLGSGDLDYVKIRLYDDGGQGLAYVDLDVSTSSLQNYLSQVQSEYASSEVLFFNFTTRGVPSRAGANELNSYSDAFIGVQVDAVNVSSVNNLDLRIDSAIAFNFLTVSEGAAEKYQEILSMVSGGDGFDISSDGDVQTMTPRLAENAINCLQVTDAGTHSLADFSCIWRYLIVNNTVTPVAAESLYLYKGGDDSAVVKTWIIENSLGSVNEFTTGLVEEYFLRACNKALTDGANENSLVCGFFDPGFRWISRVADATLDPFTLSDKTVLVLLASLKDRLSGQVVRRRLLAVDTRNSRKESGFGFEFTQVDPKINLAALSNTRERWQYVAIEAPMVASVERGVFLSNARLVLSSVRRKLGRSIESIQIVSHDFSVRQNTPSRRLLGHDSWANLTTIFKLADFNAFVHKDLLECLFFELSGNATLLSWDMAQDMVEVCSVAQGKLDSGSSNLSSVIKVTLQDCGGSNKQYEEVECMRLVGRLYRHFTPTGIDWYYIRGHSPHSSFAVWHGMLGNDTAVLMDYIREHVAFIFALSPSRVVAQRFTMNSTMIWVYADTRLPYVESSPLYLAVDLDTLWRDKLPDLLQAFSSLPELHFEGFESAIRFGGPPPFVPVARDDYFVTFALRIPFTGLSYRQAVAFEKSALTVLSREISMSPYDIYLLTSSTYAWHTIHNYKLVFATVKEAEAVFQMLSGAQTRLQDAIVKESEAYLPSVEMTNIYQSYDLVQDYPSVSGSGGFTLFLFVMCALVVVFVLWLNLFHTYKVAVKDRDIFESTFTKFAVRTTINIKMD